MNKVIIIGNISNDLELKETANTLILKLSIATNRKYKKDEKIIEEVEFSPVVFFGKTAETINKYFNKGDKICIEGRLKTNKWETENGEKRYRMEIIGEKFEFVGSNKKNTEGNEERKLPQDDLRVADVPF